MPLQLTTPITAVSDPSEETQYTQVKIKQPTIDPDEKRISFSVQYGNTISGVWTPARPYGQELRAQKFVIYNHPAVGETPADPQYDDVVAAAVSTAADELAYDLTANALYQWLIDEGHYAGTIV